MFRDARPFEHVEPFRRQVPDPRHERVAEDRARGEDMVGEADSPRSCSVVFVCRRISRTVRPVLRVI